MHIHKSDDILLLLGYASRAGQPTLTVTAGYVCNADGTRMPEQDAWKWLGPLFPDEPFDLGEKKEGGGFGVAGDACAPAGATVDGLTVRAGVGDLKRHVLVQGDRIWTRTPTGWQTTAALPFDRMPIGLARAYGGPAWRDNPYGRGHCANAQDFEGVPLPNVELPDQPMLKPTDTPALATLGPHPQGSAARNRWLGSLDKTWERTRHPWLPDDTDPRWFDRFDPAQCRPAHWRGDEPWFAENMHPRHGILRGRLPGLRPRLLLRTVAEPDRHLELDLDLDTVWLMPNDERAIVLYRGQMGVKREDAKDILGLAVFTETLAEPRHALAHWSQVWREAMEQDQAAPIVAPAPIDPEALARMQAVRNAADKQASEFKASVSKEVEQELQDAEAEATRQLTGVGFDVKALKARAAANAKASPLEFEADSELNLPHEPQAYHAALTAHIEKALKQAEHDARKHLGEQGFDVDELQARAAANPAPEPDMAAVVAGMTAMLPVPESQRQAYAKEFTAFQKEMEGLEASLQSRFKQAEQEAAASAARGDAYGGPRTGLGDTPKGPRERLTREALLDRVRTGVSAAWTELEGLDLAGVDLRGVDLSKSILRQCDMHGATLSAAKLNEALLADCNLGAAKLEHASLVRARLERCNLRDAQLAGTDFSSARLSECSAERAGFDASRWDDAQVMASSLEAATLKKATGKRAGFTNCRMPGIDASAARFDRVNFEHCALDGAIFNNASLAGSTLLTCQASRAQFDGARLPGLRTLKGTQLDHANLRGADMQDASLQETSLTHAILQEADLDRALVKECDLGRTDAWRMTARNTDFTDSRISQATWRGANLMQATLSQATILDTDLTGTNLHAAQTRTATVQGLKLDQALMTRCRLPREYDHG